MMRALLSTTLVLLLSVGSLLVGGPRGVAHASAQAALAEEASAPPFIVDGGLRAVVRDGDRADDGSYRVVSVSGIPTARRFLGTIELLPRRDGIDVVNELGFDTYLYGLAEVPQSWPEQVLEAQVIAARTYAWHVMGLSNRRDADICATVACQVFRGAEILLGANGDRWRAAVDATSGQVLLYDDQPILARYFSTSGGRTYPNEHVFPSSGPRPYLVGIEDPYDALAPLHRWEVRFTHDEFNALLAVGQSLRSTVPFRTVERLGADDDPRAEIRVTGQNGRRVEVRAIVLRDFLSSRAPELFPARFPPLRADGARPLPSTVPTTRYGVEVTSDEVVLRGLGWGHGVGMGQWGAYARALEGATPSEILSAYYNGLEPTIDPRIPATIRAGMGAARLGEEGLTLRLTAPTRLTDLAGNETALGLGSWSVDRERSRAGAPTGSRLVVTPPPGHGATLDVSATTTFPGVAWGTGETLDSIDPGHPDAFDARVTVNKPVLLRLEVRDELGHLVVERALGLAERGVHQVRWFGDGPGGERVAAGRYTLALLATDVTDAQGGRADMTRLRTVRTAPR
jgi:SpoIID/LytB domain protein